jgi:hypothetical protein
MQTAPPVPPIMSHLRQRSALDGQSPDVDNHPVLLGNHGRTMSTPILSVAIPRSDMTVDGPTKKYVLKAGNVIPHNEGELEGNESDRSSICHSPGWDDLTGNKKKKKEKQAAKDKKKAEKKKLETEAKHASRMKNRLSKAPPTNHVFNKPGIAMDRSASSPAIPTATESTQTSPAKEETKKSKGTRSRRGSIDAGLKNFFSVTQGVPSLFSKSSQSTPASTASTKESHSPSSVSSNAFIGGLKLRLSEEAAVHDRARVSSSGVATSISDHGNQTSISQISASGESQGNGSMASLKDKFPKQRPMKTSSEDESVRTPHHWDDIYAQAGRKVGANERPSSGSIADNIPMMHKSRHKQTQSSTSRQPNAQSDTQSYDFYVSSGRESSKTSISRTSRPGTSEDNVHFSRRGSSPHSIDNKTYKLRDSSVDSQNGKAIHGYVQSQRLQHKDRGITAFQDGYKDMHSTDSTVVRRSASFHSVKSRASIDASDIASGPLLGNHPLTATPGELKEDFAFFSDFSPPALYLDHLGSGSEPMTPQDHSSYGSGSLKGFQIPSKPAFSRSPIPSPVAHSFVSSNFDVDIRPTSQRAATLPVESFVRAPNSSKAERASEKFVPSSPESLYSLGTSEPSSRWSKEVGPAEVSQRQGAGSSFHTRTATDSSEDYSTLEEFSNFTTPMASRPQSQKDYFPSLSEINLKSPKAKREPVEPIVSPYSSSKKSKKAALLSGPIPLRPYENELGQQDGWSRTPTPAELEESKRAQSSGPRKSIFRTSAAPTTSSVPTKNSARTSSTIETAKESKSASSLQRQLSLSRSVSTPELQDVSFLPTLKHQALTKPTNKKEKTISSVKKGKQPASAQDPDTRELIKPPPISSPTSKSEGSSPLSPSGGAYLRDARMSLPHLPSSSPKSPKQLRFSTQSSTQLATPGSQPEPMAKMFVVCCSCKYFHDMPSKIYECMARPDNVVEDKDLGVRGVISTSVKCPWCNHGMSTTCCAGYAAVVYLREKLH